MIKSLTLTSGLESWRKHAKTVGGMMPRDSASKRPPAIPINVDSRMVYSIITALLATYSLVHQSYKCCPGFALMCLSPDDAYPNIQSVH